MPIPPFQTLLRPTLELLADQAVWRLRELEEKLALRLGVTNEEREILLPSGAMPMFYNRVGWAKWHLDRAKLVETVNRGSYRITDRGLSVLAQAPAVIDKRFLDQLYAAQSQYKVVLIDGERLAQLMVEYNLGVSVAAVYEVKRIDNDFFADE